MSRPALSSELASPLSPAEQAIGGCARTGDSPMGGPTPGAVLSLYRLLIHVAGNTAPSPLVVASWRARDRAMVRLWAERELARKITGADGCPAISLPPVLADYWDAGRAG